MQVKECYISDCEDNNFEDEDLEERSSLEQDQHTTSSSENDDNHDDDEDDDEWLAQMKENQPFDPTKITTSIPLLPFKNQVGGHAPFFRFSKRAICKPVSAREQAFYEHIDAKHHELLPFTSQYMGVLNVSYRPSENGDTPVPEVLFEKNKHLLQNWQECTKFDGNRRRHSCTPDSHPTTPITDSFYSKGLQCRAHARRKFQEKVLREVFSPKALKERLQLAEDWKRNATKVVETETEYYLTPDMPHSYSDTIRDRSHHRHHVKCWDDENPITEGGRSVPIMTGLAFKTKQKQEKERLSKKGSGGFQSRRLSTSSLLSATDDDGAIFAMDDFDIEKKSSPSPSTKQIIIRSPALHVDSVSLKKSTITMNNNNNINDNDNNNNNNNNDNDNDNDNTKHNSNNSGNNGSMKRTSDNENNKPPDNPWSLQMHNRDLQRMKNNNKDPQNSNNVQKYILIEDLTDGVKYPCVLDLKMGTRQYGVYATRDKMKSQTNKCEKSTSKVLGVRVCGLQVYKTDTSEFFFQDKYHGRTLTPTTFRDTLVNYLDNGNGCQIQHIPVIVRKLRHLARIVKEMVDYRFYASSLLMIYDGDSSSNRKIDVRIIDFANCVTAESVRYKNDQFTFPPRNHRSPDNGYLLGLKTLVSTFEWIFKEHGGSLNELATEGDDIFSDIYEHANSEVLASILQPSSFL